MKYYHSYINRQEISRETHEKLLDLTTRRRSGRPWVRYGALAACAALIIGVGVWKLVPVSDPADISCEAGQFAADYTPLPGESDTVGPDYAGASLADDTDTSFMVNSPVMYGERISPAIPAIHYSDNILDRADLSGDWAYAPGSFEVDLTKKGIQTIFWGPEGKPETEQGDLPWTLFWDGYIVHGSAWYDGQGRLIELTITGERSPGEDVLANFTLELCPGEMPHNCAIDMSREDEFSEFNGVSVAAWSTSATDELDGDGKTYIYTHCGSEFMTSNEIGVRFENWSRRIGAEDGEEMELEKSRTFNAAFVRQALTDGLYLNHLMLADYVPAWRDEAFSSLAQARQVAEFALYLPAREPEAFSSCTGDKEFHGFLSYQEGIENRLCVRWSWENYNVEVTIHRDGDGSYRDAYDYYRGHMVDADNPASYDVRLYEGPEFTPVPEEYWDTLFVGCAFRAEDMSLSMVEARGRKDYFSGLKFSFDVVHPDGTVVGYYCTGVTAREVWEMVEGTL